MKSPLKNRFTLFIKNKLYTIPEMLRITTIPNEYYFGDLPGTLQYKVTKEELAELDLSIDDEETRGFRLDFHTEDNYRRLLPDTATGNANSWRILLVMRAERENGIICLKGALENKDTGEIALMTSTNSEEYLTSHGHRAIHSHDPKWFVGHYRMAAPMVFWRELVNRIRY
jgi:hypothetical protein